MRTGNREKGGWEIGTLLQSHPSFSTLPFCLKQTFLFSGMVSQHIPLLSCLSLSISGAYIASLDTQCINFTCGIKKQWVSAQSACKEHLTDCIAEGCLEPGLFSRMNTGRTYPRPFFLHSFSSHMYFQDSKSGQAEHHDVNQGKM